MDDAFVEQLEKLQGLREAGALTQAEFSAAKRKLLGEASARPSRYRRWQLYAGLGVAAAVTAVVGVWAAKDGRVSTKSSPVSAETIRAAHNPQPATISPPAPLSPSARLAAAFEAATGQRAAFSRVEDGEVVTMTPLRIVDLPFGPALLTKREIKDGCHACAGAIGVYYLKEDAGTILVTRRWPEAVQGWGWGAAPQQWEVTTRFTSNPAIFASGGYMGQGILMEGATLTELQPSGPVASDSIGLGYSDEGAAIEGKVACIVKGRIGPLQKDRWFDVIVQGTINEVERYVKREGRFVATSTIDWEAPCQP